MESVKNKKVIRVDDVCNKTEHQKLDAIRRVFPKGEFEIMHVISPLYTSVSRANEITLPYKNHERVFPEMFNCLSDWRIFTQVDMATNPSMYNHTYRDKLFDVIASHGVIHVDHRLLDKSAQELSICISCSMVGSKIFVPPFNKYNQHTIDICKELGVELVKWESGWKCLDYEKFDDSCDNWYLHTYNLSMEQIENLRK